MLKKGKVAQRHAKTFIGLKDHLSQALHCLGQGINCQQQDLFPCTLLSYLLDAGRQALMMIAGCSAINLRVRHGVTYLSSLSPNSLFASSNQYLKSHSAAEYGNTVV